MSLISCRCLLSSLFLSLSLSLFLSAGLSLFLFWLTWECHRLCPFAGGSPGSPIWLSPNAWLMNKCEGCKGVQGVEGRGGAGTGLPLAAAAAAGVGRPFEITLSKCQSWVKQAISLWHLCYLIEPLPIKLPLPLQFQLMLPQQQQQQQLKAWPTGRAIWLRTSRSIKHFCIITKINLKYPQNATSYWIPPPALYTPGTFLPPFNSLRFARVVVFNFNRLS